MIPKVIKQVSLTKKGFLFTMIKFPLPDLGEKIKEGTIKKLYVEQGEKVIQFQKIADVESDKQFTEITAPEDGLISKIYYKETQVCKVGDLFMEIDNGKQSTISQKQSLKQDHKTFHSNSHRSNNSVVYKNFYHDHSILASVSVLMYAHSKKVNIKNIKGTGKHGRILKGDIINFVEGKQKSQTTEITYESPLKSYQNTKVSMNPFQKGMQKTMTQANSVPHLYFHQSMDITELSAIRQKIKNAGHKVTIMGLLIKTFSNALIHHPRINSTYQQQKDKFSFETHSQHNISLAIDSPNGLVVPNIKKVQDLNIIQIQQKLSHLKALSDSAKLTKQELEGGTICLSNIGTIAGISACPLVLFPQVTIVAIGKIVETPIVFGETFTKRKFITMSFGCDHRIIDGASVAKFSNSWKSILQNPYLSLATMK